ncbi:MAG: hypothetical protein M3Y30_15745, partial [Gemmatimonadota bacterium]|nr:hypothetical protein [Gemmatimonadota bacterium]
VLYDVAAGTADPEIPSTPFNNIAPTGINDSQLISENADILDLASENPPLPVAQVASQSTSAGLVLPPGVIGDHTAGINSAGIVAGQSNGLPVLWIPNP